MGRVRGKGKKLTVATSNEDQGSGDEEVIPPFKRRGRPQKPMKDDIYDNDAENLEEGEDDAKFTASSKETTVVNEKKRKRFSKAKENSDLVKEEISAGSKSKIDDLVRSNGFRHNGSRRKSKPQRAAEAGVECK
ncbi:hypothetical protein Cni_G20810 [Canna indica]|uniref:Uncharacterized protein n=1 Tax=Canna indica TaxID=4628 RepID=A0AAQ3QK52_9LILI|nr:hypothetical protein Cni_G20810 [Canna indica]